MSRGKKFTSTVVQSSTKSTFTHLLEMEYERERKGEDVPLYGIWNQFELNRRERFEFEALNDIPDRKYKFMSAGGTAPTGLSLMSQMPVALKSHTIPVDFLIPGTKESYQWNVRFTDEEAICHASCPCSQEDDCVHRLAALYLAATRLGMSNTQEVAWCDDNKAQSHLEIYQRFLADHSMKKPEDLENLLLLSESGYITLKELPQVMVYSKNLAAKKPYKRKPGINPLSVRR